MLGKFKGELELSTWVIYALIIICPCGLIQGQVSTEEESIKTLVKVTTIHPPTSKEVVGHGQVFENTSSWANDFEADDLVDLVEELERDALDEEKAEIIPEIMTFLNGALGNNGQGLSVGTSSTKGGVGDVETNEDDLGDDDEGEEDDDEDDEVTLRLPHDLSDLPEDIADDITAGVEESLKLFQGSENGTGREGEEVETRQLSMYLFQGQYVPEPRLNRFIDGAFRNMGTEMRISSMDPLYFRVLPRGRVAQREQPVAQKFANRNKVRRRRPGQKNRIRVGRDLTSNNKSSVNGTEKPVEVDGEGRAGFTLRRRQKIQRQRQQKRRQQRIRARRRRQRQRQRLRQKGKRRGQQKVRSRGKKGKKKKGATRIRRRIAQNVGGGRVEGLSRVARDADAEMQLFGNYTLIRSHMRIGPVELTMQFRTRKGIRRTGATLPVIRAHTVTRVNHEGSEMVDFLLDRPHPETIKVRGNLFPLAQKIARNIFARLFLPDSFLVERMREKTGLALLSRPIDRRRRR